MSRSESKFAPPLAPKSTHPFSHIATRSQTLQIMKEFSETFYESIQAIMPALLGWSYRARSLQIVVSRGSSFPSDIVTTAAPRKTSPISFTWWLRSAISCWLMILSAQSSQEHWTSRNLTRTSWRALVTLSHLPLHGSRARDHPRRKKYRYILERPPSPICLTD